MFGANFEQWDSVWSFRDLLFYIALAYARVKFIKLTWYLLCSQNWELIFRCHCAIWITVWHRKDLLLPVISFYLYRVGKMQRRRPGLQQSFLLRDLHMCAKLLPRRSMSHIRKYFPPPTVWQRMQCFNARYSKYLELHVYHQDRGIQTLCGKIVPICQIMSMNIINYYWTYRPPACSPVCSCKFHHCTVRRD